MKCELRPQLGVINETDGPGRSKANGAEGGGGGSG
jgi:hypothetical protein